MVEKQQSGPRGGVNSRRRNQEGDMYSYAIPDTRNVKYDSNELTKKKKEVRQKVLIDKQDTVRWGGVSDCPATGRT